MNSSLLALMSGLLCAATLQSATADPAVPLLIETSEEVNSVVTDVPEIIDMSRADPKTWHKLPSTAYIHDQSPADVGSQELEFSDSLAL